MKRNASTFVNSSKDGSTDALKVMARSVAWITVFCNLSPSTSLGASPYVQRLQQQSGFTKLVYHWWKCVVIWLFCGNVYSTYYFRVSFIRVFLFRQMVLQ